MDEVRVLELFCGLGGVAAALGEAAAAGAAEVAAAIDVDRRALAVYAANHPGPTVARTLDSIRPADLAAFAADLWTMSPPCQPFTRRGHGRDLDDPRSRGFLAVLAAVEAVRPPWLFLENVPAFVASRAHRRLTATLAAAGYRWHERLLCPSELGIPNRRRRYYLVAGRDDVPLGEPAIPRQAPRRRPLAGFLDPDPAPELTVPAEVVRRYRHALDVVDRDDPDAVTACFTSAYGRSPVRSGSYLLVKQEDGANGEERIGKREEPGGRRRSEIEPGEDWRGADGSRGGRHPEQSEPARPPEAADLPTLRRFSPAEILRLLGFPPAFRLPPDLPLAAGWHLAGNSLSLPAVRALLAAVPPLAPFLQETPRSGTDATNPSLAVLGSSPSTSGKERRPPSRRGPLGREA